MKLHVQNYPGWIDSKSKLNVKQHFIIIIIINCTLLKLLTKLHIQNCIKISLVEIIRSPSPMSKSILDHWHSIYNLN